MKILALTLTVAIAVMLNGCGGQDLVSEAKAKGGEIACRVYEHGWIVLNDVRYDKNSGDIVGYIADNKVYITPGACEIRHPKGGE